MTNRAFRKSHDPRLDKINSENGGKTMTTKWNGGRPKNPKRASSRQQRMYRQNLTQGAGGWNIGRLEPEEDKNYLINNATFGSGNMNLNDTYGEAEMSKAYDLAKQIRVGTVPKSPKRQMLYFVRDMVHFYRSNGFHRLADTMAKDIQFFDVNEIFEYVSINLENIFPELETPPSTDVVLPADKVGLYCNLLEQDGWDDLNPDKKGAEAMYILSNLVDDPEDERYCRIFGIDVVYRPVSTDTLADTKPLEVGTVDSIKGTITPYDDTIEKHKPLMIQMAQFACGFLQTINTPRFVIQRQQKVHPFHKAKIKKMLGKFTPDSWNLVQWNVGEPVKSKDEETKSGGKQALHFRRGHPRKAEEHWDKVYWSTVRNRWEQYIHGYEAGHPRFGIKKSYHLPRKEV